MHLIKLSSSSYLESEVTSEPYCELENLLNNSEGLVVLSGTVYDLFGKLFKLNKLDLIKNLLEKYNFGDIDVLQIDAEGYDFQIINSLEDIKPKIINFDLST